jgi:hypothetical protein
MTADGATTRPEAWWVRLFDGVRTAVRAVRVTAPQRRGIAVRAMLCIGLPLVIGLTSGHIVEGAAASFGGLAGFSVPESPYRYRAKVVAGVGAGLVAAVLFGALAASQGWVAAVVAGGIAGLASFVCQAAELPPPREPRSGAQNRALATING